MPHFCDDSAAPQNWDAQNAIETSLRLMNWSRLAQFKEFDDDKRGMTREVVALFASDVPHRINAIRAFSQGRGLSGVNEAGQAARVAFGLALHRGH